MFLNFNKPSATTGGQQRQTVFTRNMKLVPSAKSDTIIIANDMLKTTHNSGRTNFDRGNAVLAFISMEALPRGSPSGHAEVIERIAMSCRFACFLTLT